MTGTGTQADPYRPETWEEIIEAIGVADAYVECVEGLDIDLNDRDDNDVIIKAIHINFNDCVIRNYNHVSNPLFQVQKTVNINNVHIIDFMIPTNENGDGTVFAGTTSVSLFRCSFVGLSFRGLFYANKNGSTQNINVDECYLDIRVLNTNGGFFWSSYGYGIINLNYSYVYIETPNGSTASTSRQSTSVISSNGSLILGSISQLGLKGSIANTLINCKIGCIYNWSPKMSGLLINAKVIEGKDSVYIADGLSYIPVTDEELHDTVALRNKGLPIHIAEGDRYHE